jgi:hypothetical protein
MGVKGPMQKKFNGLTDQQTVLVLAVLAGKEIPVAASEAGYNSTQAAYGALRAHSVCSAMRTEITKRLTMEGAPLGYRVLVGLARDETVPAAVRRACARDLLDRAGFIPPRAAAAESGDEKPLQDMSSDELRALIDRTESELGARATPINAPINALPALKPMEWLD